MGITVILYLTIWVVGVILQFILHRKLKQGGSITSEPLKGNGLHFLRTISSKEWLRQQDRGIVRLCLVYKILLAAILILLLLLAWMIPNSKPATEPAKNSGSLHREVIPSGMHEDPLVATLLPLFSISWVSTAVLHFILRRKLKQRGVDVSGHSILDNIRYNRMIFSKKWLNQQDQGIIRLCLAYKISAGVMLVSLVLAMWALSAFWAEARLRPKPSALALPGSEAI